MEILKKALDHFCVNARFANGCFEPQEPFANADQVFVRFAEEIIQQLRIEAWWDFLAQEAAPMFGGQTSRRNRCRSPTFTGFTRYSVAPNRAARSLSS